MGYVAELERSAGIHIHRPDGFHDFHAQLTNIGAGYQSVHVESVEQPNSVEVSFHKLQQLHVYSPFLHRYRLSQWPNK